jgi:hypothetical protein
VILPFGDIISYMMVKWFASGISSYVTGNPYPRAVAGEIGGLLAQQRQFGAADHQRQRL